MARASRGKSANAVFAESESTNKIDPMETQ